MDKRYIIVLTVTVGVYLFMKFLSPIFSPFIYPKLIPPVPITINTPIYQQNLSDFPFSESFLSSP